MAEDFWRRLRLIAPASALLLWLFAVPMATAAADNSPVSIRADPVQIAALLLEKDYPTEHKLDSNGDPYLTGKHNDRNFFIYFYGCSGGVRASGCTMVQFYCAFTLGRPFPLDRINEWNSTRRFGRAYVDADQDAAAEMDFNLDGGGMPRELFLDNLSIWFEVMEGFDEFVFAEPDRRPEAKSAGAPAAD